MDPRRSIKAGAALVGAIGLGAALAMTTDTPLFDPANGARVPASWLGTMAEVLVFSLVACFAIGTVAMLSQLPFSSRANLKLPKKRGRWSMILLLGVLVIAVNLVDRFRGDPAPSPDRATEVDTPGAGDAERPPALPQTQVRWTLIGGAAAISAVGIVGAMLADRRSRTGTPTDDAPSNDALEDDRQRHAVANRLVTGIDELGDLTGDPRQAILRAHHHLESILADVGIVRPASETSSEYLTRILAVLTPHEPSPRPGGASAGATRLTELVELALYSTRPLGLSDREAAADALGAVRDELRSAHVGA